MPNPYAIIAALGIWIATAVGGYFYGGHVKTLAYQVALANQSASAQKILADAQEHARSVESKYQDLSIKIEADHADALKTIDAAAAHNADLARRIGLYDRAGRRQSCGDNVSGASQGTGSDPSAAAGIRLSDELAGQLISEAARADRAAEYARACHDWAVGLKN